MKRSEMVDEIVQYFKNSHHYTVYDDMAEEILKCVESLGMLPPTLTGEVETEETEDGGLAVKLWGWESEDEN